MGRCRDASFGQPHGCGFVSRPRDSALFGPFVSWMFQLDQAACFAYVPGGNKNKYGNRELAYTRDLFTLGSLGISDLMSHACQSNT
jgi:hypothetical protein